MSQCVVAVYESPRIAQEAVAALEQSHLPSEAISLVTHSVEAEIPSEEPLQHGDETESDAATGAGVGGLLGLLAGASMLAVPGIGPLLVVGPLAGAMTGAIVGGLVGAMTGWGVHEDHVKEYERELREGALLVVVTGDPQQVSEAKRILDGSGAKEVHLHAESSSDHVDK